MLKRHGGGSYKLKIKIEYADMAQLVEQLIRNEQVVGSSPTISSNGKPRKLGVYGVFFVSVC